MNKNLIGILLLMKRKISQNDTKRIYFYWHGVGHLEWVKLHLNTEDIKVLRNVYMK